MRSYPAYDQTIQVDCYTVPETLWLRAGFEVQVGGRVFPPRPGRLPFTLQSWTAFDFTANGRQVSGMVRDISPWWAVRQRRYSLVVGLSELARETQPVRGQFLTLVALMVLALLAVCVVYGVILTRQLLGH